MQDMKKEKWKLKYLFCVTSEKRLLGIQSALMVNVTKVIVV